MRKFIYFLKFIGFLMANEIENYSLFIKEGERPGRLIKTIHSTLKTDCILQCTSIKQDRRSKNESGGAEPPAPMLRRAC